MIFYLHIPKTGGQTLATRLASAFHPDKAHIITDDMRFPQDCDRLNRFRQSKDFVEAHVTGPLLRDSTDNILCTVRDPIEQIISVYRHILREPANELHNPARLLSFADFFTHFGDTFANIQTKMLITPFFHMRPEDSLNEYGFLLSKLLDVANRIRWLVPSEQIDEFTVLWSLESKRAVPLISTQVNVAPQNDELLEGWRHYLHKRSDLYDLSIFCFGTKPGANLPIIEILFLRPRSAV